MRRLLKRIRTTSDRVRETESENDEQALATASRLPSSLEILLHDSSRYGLRPLPTIPTNSSGDSSLFEVDVVLVHGLGGDFFKTWMYKREGRRERDVFWPSQLLPEHLPGARIFSFGYESSPAFSRSVAGVRDSAMQLLQHLLPVVSNGRRRLVIFICHSLGGIVVKQAIITAHEDSRFADVLDKSRIIMFLGTPHRGSDIATALRRMATLSNFWLGISGASAFSGSMRSDLIELLARNSIALGDIHESFIRRANRLHIISCYETILPIGLQKLVVDKFSAVLHVPGEVVVPLDADHMSMCRFYDDRDPNFQLAWTALIGIITSINCEARSVEPFLKSLPSRQSLTSSERKFVNRFETTHQVDIDNRVSGTCVWLLDNPVYHEWSQRQGPEFLWVTGEAGCGKTMLTAFLFENLNKQEGDSSPMLPGDDIKCCFFCARDIETHNDARYVLGALLRQILLSRRDIIHKVRSSFDIVKHEFNPSFESLWKLFRFVVDMVPCTHLYIVIDALDECDSRSKEKLLAAFAKILDADGNPLLTSASKLKIVISSQPHVVTTWNTVTQRLVNYQIQIGEELDQMVNDVRMFIDYRINRLVANLTCTSSMGERLKKALHPLAENSFLWVSVVLNHISSIVDFREVDFTRVLNSTPPTLWDVYTNYLPQPESHNTSRIQLFVQFLVACTRPLSLREFYVLSAHGEQLNTQAIEHESDAVMRASLQRAFGPLVKFPAGNVQFVHSTVGEFFVALKANQQRNLSDSYGTSVVSAHLSLATHCICYLMQEEFKDDLAEINDIQDEENLREELYRETCLRFEAFAYAAQYWTYHYAESEDCVPTELSEQAMALLDCKSPRFFNWYQYVANQSKTLMPPSNEVDSIVVIAFFNHVVALRNQLQRGAEVSSKTIQSALFWAASRGHARAVEMLLASHAGVKVPERGQSALTVAIHGGFRDIVEILLSSGYFDVNFSNRDNRPPLVTAVASHHQEIMDTLLHEEGTQINQADNSGITALMEASRLNEVQIIRALLQDRSLNVNGIDSTGRTALMHAAENDSAFSVDLLLKCRQLELHARSSTGRNAMSYAAQRGQLALVRKLHHARVSVSDRDFQGRNAISWAANSTQALTMDDRGRSTLHYLIEKCPEGADVRDENGWTPLAWALDRPGHLASVRLLLDSGHVNINQKDSTFGRPILAWAAAEGFVEITRYLLSVPSLMKNLTDHDGRTALSYAAGNGMVGVVEVLLEDLDISPDLPDRKGRTPSGWAALNQHSSIVDILDRRDQKVAGRNLRP